MMVSEDATLRSRTFHSEVTSNSSHAGHSHPPVTGTAPRRRLQHRQRREQHFVPITALEVSVTLSPLHNQGKRSELSPRDIPQEFMVIRHSPRAFVAGILGQVNLGEAPGDFEKTDSV